MTPERHALAKEIFLATIDADPTDRKAILQNRCGDDAELLGQVEQLLAHHDERTLSPDPGSATVTTLDVQGDETQPTSADGEPAPRREVRESTRKRDDELEYQPGDVLAGRYGLVARLGRGGMGVVYRAEDLTLEQPVALKFLNPSMGNNPVWLDRLRKEVRIAREVSHPNVCRVYDIGQCNGVHFISMEYIDGEDLSSLIRRIGRLPNEKAIDIARQLCIGLAAAHSAGILHRDLKPANVMLDGDGRVRITDFGLAASPDTIPAGEVRAGTPAYMAPEQISGKEVSVRSDIYSLGLILYELICGRPAFEAKTVSEFAKLHSESDPTALDKLVPDVDPSVQHVIHSCLLKDPLERPGSALEVAAALPGTDLLAAALAANIIPTPEMVAAARPVDARPIGANRLLAIAVMILVALLVARNFSKHPWEQREAKAPEVLAERARELLKSVRTTKASGAPAYGFCDPDDAVSLAAKSISLDVDTARLTTVSDSSLFFWYRLRTSSLHPRNAFNLTLGSGRVTPLDPPPAERGSSIVILDLKGRLKFFVSRPDTEETGADRVSHASPLDLWMPFIKLAGLDASEATDTEPRPKKLPEATGHWSWLFPDPQFEGSHIRADAMVYKDRPILFFARPEEVSPTAVNQLQDLHRRKNLMSISRATMFFVLTLVAIPWAWKNAKYRNWDRRGVIRLFLFLFAVRMIVWLLGAAHTLHYVDEIHRLSIACMRALGTAAMVAVLYVALEPYARKHWPQLLISWSRALTGKMHDAVVGQHILIGICVGCFWSLMQASERAIVIALGWTLRHSVGSEEVASKLVGFRVAVASYLDTVPYAIEQGLVLLLFLAALRAIVGKARVAAVIAAVILFAYTMPLGAHFATALIFMCFGVAAVGVWLMARFGLLALVCALLSGSILNTSPMSLHFTQWYSDSTVCALGLVALMITFGYTAARRSGAPT